MSTLCLSPFEQRCVSKLDLNQVLLLLGGKVLLDKQKLSIDQWHDDENEQVIYFKHCAIDSSTDMPTICQQYTLIDAQQLPNHPQLVCIQVCYIAAQDTKIDWLGLRCYAKNTIYGRQVNLDNWSLCAMRHERITHQSFWYDLWLSNLWGSYVLVSCNIMDGCYAFDQCAWLFPTGTCKY